MRARRASALAISEASASPAARKAAEAASKSVCAGALDERALAHHERAAGVRAGRFLERREREALEARDLGGGFGGAGAQDQALDRRAFGEGLKR
jgi:hypothetical protein